MSAEANGEGEREARLDPPDRADADRTPVRPAGRRLLTPAIGASLMILLVSATTSMAWVVGHGGVALPARPTSGVVAGASAEPATRSDGPAPTLDQSRAPSTQSPSPVPGGPAMTMAPTARPSVPAPSPTSDRYAVLVPCPATPRCYRYTVRRGDNLWSIASWFGIPLDTVYELNPALRTTTLRPGMELALPPPTR